MSKAQDIEGWAVTKLRVKGFKSIGTQQVTAVFPRGLCCIVGPNGSGKSNLLDAICFVSGCSAATLGVQRLSDLQCTDVQEVCEVSAEVSSASDGRTHTILCSMTAATGRTYKLNGKLKTGTEIKNFLKGKSINMDQSHCLIKQAQVTRLADNNSPQQLASVIHDTSGYTRWSNEAAAALEELEKTKSALQAISHNVSCLEASVLKDEEKHGAAARVAQLECDLLEVQQSMAAGLQTQDLLVTKELQAAEQQSKELQAHLSACQSNLSQILQKIKQRLEEAHMSSKQDTTDLQIQQRLVAASQEEVIIAQKQCSEAEHTLKRVDVASRHHASMQTQCDNATHKLSRQQQLSAAVEASYKQCISGSLAGPSAADCHKQVAKLEQELKDATQMQQKAAADGLHAEQQLAEAQDNLTRVAATVAPASNSNTPAEVKCLQSAVQHMRAEAESSRQARNAAASRAQMLNIELGTVSMHAPRGSVPPKHIMLHECFRFKDPAGGHLASLMQALHLIAGDKLSVVIVDDATAAAELLAWHNKNTNQQGFARTVRIWDLQRLRAYDKLHQQQKAQAAFLPGEVTIPLDLLTYNQTHHTAMLRAFGGSVIAKDDSVAGRLATTFGLASITLDGKITRPGSIQGGWRGNDNGRLTAIAKKRQADQLQAERDVAQSKAHEAESQVAELQQQLEAQQAAAAAHAEAAEQAQTLKQEISDHQQAVITHQQRVAECQALANCLQSSLAQTKQLATTCSGSKDDGSNIREELLEQLHEARSGLEEATHWHSEAQLQVEAASDELILATEQAEDISLNTLKQELDHKEQKLQQQVTHLQHLQAESQLCKQANQQATAQLQSMQHEEQDLNRQIAGLKGKAKVLQQAHQQLSQQKQSVTTELDLLFKQIPELAKVSSSLGLPPAEGPDRTVDTCQRDVKRMRTQCKRLQEELRTNKAKQLPTAELMQFQKRKSDLVVFKERAEALKQAVCILEEGIAASRAQVVQTDEAVFDAIEAKFNTLTAGLLPKLEVKIARVGEKVHEGVCFWYRCTSGSATAAATWQNSLGRLSGGERTLTCLAFILAAATAGAHNSLFLMDEVDAALDETNQAAVASLLKEIMAQNAGCQVLCVTHNVAFQQLCSSIIQVSKDASGVTQVQSTTQ